MLRNIGALAIHGVCDWSVPQLWFLSLILGFTLLQIFDSISYALFFGLYSVMSAMTYSSYFLMTVLLFWMELKVSIKRFEMFLALPELEKCISDSGTSSSSSEENQGVDSDVISGIDLSFVWNIRLEQQQPVEERRVFQTMLSSDYEGLTDANKNS